MLLASTLIIFHVPLVFAEELLDSYDNSYYGAIIPLSTGYDLKMGQSFYATDYWNITKVGFNLLKWNSTEGYPNGTLSAHIYAHNGTFGVNGTPTGDPLGSSASINISTIPAYPAHAVFNFTFSPQIVLAPATPYFAVVSLDDGHETDIYHVVSVVLDNGENGHDGNSAVYPDGDPVWSSDPDFDHTFYLYGDSEPYETVTITAVAYNNSDLTEITAGSIMVTDILGNSTTFSLPASFSVNKDQNYTYTVYGDADWTFNSTILAGTTNPFNWSFSGPFPIACYFDYAGYNLTPVPIIFIFGMVGLGCMFVGPVYAINKLKQKEYRHGLVWGVIITALGFSLFIAWLFGGNF